MSALSPALRAQMFAQESIDPFLSLLTLSHPSFAADVLLVNNSVDIISRGLTFKAFPFKITLPIDDGESARDVAIEMDNVSLELISLFRSVVNEKINVKLEMILASIPDSVQSVLDELKVAQIKYDRNKISATLVVDTFLNSSMTSERYTPQNFPGLF